MPHCWPVPAPAVRSPPRTGAAARAPARTSDWMGRMSWGCFKRSHGMKISLYEVF
jgi:hypothetical protein